MHIHDYHQPSPNDCLGRKTITHDDQLTLRTSVALEPYELFAPKDEPCTPAIMRSSIGHDAALPLPDDEPDCEPASRLSFPALPIEPVVGRTTLELAGDQPAKADAGPPSRLSVDKGLDLTAGWFTATPPSTGPACVAIGHDEYVEQVFLATFAEATDQTDISSVWRSYCPQDTDAVGCALLAALCAVTYLGCPSELAPAVVQLHHVWYYGWLTAVSTGLGALPFAVVRNPSKTATGLCNAAAGGMMLAASYQLAVAGLSGDQLSHTAAGVLLGVAFIVGTQHALERFGGEDAKTDLVGSAMDFRKVLLIVLVMTLHSMSEGIGIGVSFGGAKQLGIFISLSLAVHNVPEGLAVALVLCSRKTSVLRSGLWAVFTSLPQPLMAIPAYLFVQSFASILPVGLGFAAGAMAYVAVFELLQDAVEETKSVLVAGGVAATAFVTMMILQGLAHGLSETIHDLTY